MDAIEVEIPENSTVIREVRLVQYMDEEGVAGLAIGVDGDSGFDVIATLGMLAMASSLLATGNLED